MQLLQKYELGWKHIMPSPPPQIIVTNTKILHLVFSCACAHRILNYFCSFQVCSINFRLKLVHLKRNSNKHLRIWTYKIYLCWNKYVTKYEKLQIYFKTKGYGPWSFVMNFFVVNDFCIHQLNLIPLKKFKVFGQKFIQKCFIFHF